MMTDLADRSVAPAPTGPSLPDLFDLDPAGPVWRQADLAGLFRHQLDSPLEPAVGPLHPSAGKLLAAAGPSVRTFGDLLRTAAPPVGLLRLAKRYAKARRHGGATAVPPEVDKLLYAAAVVAARLRLNERITELPDAVFAANVRWAAEQPWAGEEVRGLMREWLGCYADGEPRPPT